MWQHIVLRTFSIHYPWLIALLTLFLTIICSTKGNVLKKDSTQQPKLSKSDGNNSKSPDKAVAESKDPKINRTQSAESESNLNAVFDLKKIQQYHDEQQKNSVRTDLRSLEEFKFNFKPKQQAADVKPAPNNPQPQLAQTTAVDRGKQKERELTMLTPDGAKAQLSDNSKISVYDPLLQAKEGLTGPKNEVKR